MHVLIVFCCKQKDPLPFPAASILGPAGILKGPCCEFSLRCLCFSSRRPAAQCGCIAVTSQAGSLRHNLGMARCKVGWQGGAGQQEERAGGTVLQRQASMGGKDVARKWGGGRAKKLGRHSGKQSGRAAAGRQRRRGRLVAQAGRHSCLC